MGMKQLAVWVVLALMGLSMVACSVVEEAIKPHLGTLVISATEDAHITTDASTTADPQGLRDRNFGSQDFLSVSYANKVQRDEQLIVLSLLKFDLSSLNNREVLSATLQLFGLRADLTQPARLVDVSLAETGWAEKEITFNNKPNWSGNPIATTAVYGGGLWYSWDVTGAVARLKGQSISYVMGLRTVEEKKSEQVLFAAREVGPSNSPRLMVTYVEPPTGLPWYVWTLGALVVVLIAVLAFLIGLRLARRQGRLPRGSSPTTAATP